MSEEAAVPIWLSEAAEGPRRRKWISALSKRIQQPQVLSGGRSFLTPSPTSDQVTMCLGSAGSCVGGGGAIELWARVEVYRPAGS